MNVNLGNAFIQCTYNLIKHYNHRKYWRIREVVIDPASKCPKLIRLYYLLRIKMMDAYGNSSMGTDLNRGAIFLSSPNLPHGLNGITISPFAKIGKNCTIFQHVTIAVGNDARSPVIGDNCLIGVGAVIIGDITIGDNVKIGANCVVLKNIPSNCTAVGVPARIIMS